MSRILISVVMMSLVLVNGAIITIGQGSFWSWVAVIACSLSVIGNVGSLYYEKREEVERGGVAPARDDLSEFGLEDTEDENDPFNGL